MSSLQSMGWRVTHFSLDPKTLVLLQELSRAFQALHAVNNEDELYQTLATIVVELFETDRASVSTLVDSNTVKMRALSGGEVHGKGVCIPTAGSSIEEVLKTNSAVVRDLFEKPDGSEELIAEGIRWVMCVPLVRGAQTLGSINLGRRNKAYTESEALAVEQIALCAAGSLERLELVEKVSSESIQHERRAHRMEGLAFFASEVGASRTRDELFSVLVQQINLLFNNLRSSFATFEQNGEFARLVTVAGNPGSKEGIKSNAHVIPTEGTGLRDVFLYAKSSIEYDLASSTSVMHQQLYEAGIRASISVPLLSNGAVEGVLNIGFSCASQINEETQALTEAVANVTGAMLERIQAEKALREAQKLESLGALAGGLAHDFNNLLGAALGHLSVAEEIAPPGSELREDLSCVRVALERSARLTHQMLAYVGRSSREMERVNLNQTLLEIGQLLSASLPGHVTLYYELSARSPVVKGDATQLQQVLVNLLTNAADAVGDVCGDVRLKTFSKQLVVPFSSKLIPGHVLAPGRYAVLVCTDTGKGMKAEIIPRMFEPYFTTKPTGHGLGLATVLGIVREHQGDLRVCSAPGNGTTIEVWLPEEQMPKSSAEASSTDTMPLALVIDDEKIMRQAATRMLKHLGYHTITTADGLEGLEVFRREHHRLSLVLTDQSMPRMSGTEAIAQMRDVDPNIPMIIMTGFDAREALTALQPESEVGVLHKPFLLSELRALINKHVSRQLC